MARARIGREHGRAFLQETAERANAEFARQYLARNTVMGRELVQNGSILFRSRQHNPGAAVLMNQVQSFTVRILRPDVRLSSSRHEGSDNGRVRRGVQLWLLRLSAALSLGRGVSPPDDRAAESGAG